MATLSTTFKDQFRMIVSTNVSHFVKICHVLTILQYTDLSACRGVANFGTRCIFESSCSMVEGSLKFPALHPSAASFPAASSEKATITSPAAPDDVFNDVFE